MRVWSIYLLATMLFLGCNGAEEERRTQEAAENNLKQLELAMQNYYGTRESPALSHVISAETDYYTSGPQQGRPADGTFPAGTKVRLLEEADSYVLVQADDVKAYVAADAIEEPEGLAGNPETVARDVAGVVESSNQFAVDLYQQLRSEEGNLFFSPSSIATALAMTYAGAAGETEAEMKKTLHFQMPNERLHEGMKTLQLFWETPAEAKGIRLNLANRLWGQESYEFLPEFLEITREKYGAELTEMNFEKSESARQTINEWVEEQTEDKITDLIPEGAITSDTRLVLTNAVYFHGTWTQSFKKDRTKDEDFHLTPDRKVKVPMMHRQDAFQFAEIDGLQILELPYGDGSLSMVVFLPKEVDGLADLEAELTHENLQRWLAGLKREDEVRVYLPRFKTTSQFELGETLGAMGMASAFDPKAADFSGMTGGRDLFVSAAIHKAFVDVNEEGTEAAAATGAVFGITSAPLEQEPLVFRADHPFVFIIQDNRNKAILFVGRITNPQE